MTSSGSQYSEPLHRHLSFEARRFPNSIVVSPKYRSWLFGIASLTLAPNYPVTIPKGNMPNSYTAVTFGTMSGWTKVSTELTQAAATKITVMTCTNEATAWTNARTSGCAQRHSEAYRGLNGHCNTTTSE